MIWIIFAASMVIGILGIIAGAATLSRIYFPPKS
jgi:hypothetical protein